MEIEYQLKSKPDISVTIPADYASKAESLVNLALGGISWLGCISFLATAFSEYPQLENPGISARAMSLIKTEAGTPESLRLQDEVYLRVCIYENEQKMTDRENRKQAIELDETLTRIVDEL